MDNKLLVYEITDEFAQNFMMNSNLNTRNLCNTFTNYYNNSNSKKCPNGFIIEEDSFGKKSNNGKIYKACCDDNCEYIAKWQNNKENALNEAQIQNYFAQLGIAPKIIEVWECSNGVIIIMDKLNETVKDIILELSPLQIYNTKKYYTKIFNDKLNELEKKIKKLEFDELNYESINFLKDLIKNIKNYHDMLKIRSSINILCYRNNIDPIAQIKVITEDAKAQRDLKIYIVDQIISLIYTIHRHNIVHLDTHSNNFLIDKNLNVKIIDFGEFKQDTDLDYRKFDYERFIRDIRTWISEYGYKNLKYLYNYINDKYHEIIKNSI
jgi:serine/threonine protein kinase